MNCFPARVRVLTDSPQLVVDAPRGMVHIFVFPQKGDKKDEETSQSEGNNDSDAATSRQGTQYSTQHSRRQFSLGNESQV